MKPIGRRKFASLALIPLVTTACGGGGDGNNPPAPIGPPVITEQPQAQAIREGGTARFEVKVHDDAGVQYQWKRNGTALSGATSSVYTITAAPLAANGASYSVSVSNQAGAVESSVVTLTVSLAQGVSVQEWAHPSNLSDQDIGASGFTYAVLRDGTVSKLVRRNTAGAVVDLTPSLRELVLPELAASERALIRVSETADGVLYVSHAREIPGINSGRAAGGRLLRIAANGSAVVLYESTDITPVGVALDAAGNLFTADFARGSVYRLTPAGEFSLFAALPATTPAYTWSRAIWLQRTTDGRIATARQGSDGGSTALVRSDGSVTTPTIPNAVGGLGTWGQDVYMLVREAGTQRILKLRNDGTSESIAQSSVTGASQPGKLGDQLSWVGQASNSSIYLWDAAANQRVVLTLA